VGKGSNQVSNYPGEEAAGKIDLVNATAHSVNTVFAGLNEKLYDLADRQGQPGDRTRDAALRAGLPKDAIGREISNTLGNGTPTVAQMANAYGTIAAGGTYRPYYVIEKIHYPNGQPRYTHHDESDRRFSKDVTADVTFAMQQVLRRGTGADARRILKGRPAAGKTGTVGSLEGNGRDTMAAWFVGFTPQLSTSVVIYRETPTQARAPVKGWGPFAGQNMTGGMFPVRIWATFMDRALKGKPFIDLPEPAFVGESLDPAPELPDEAELPSDPDGQNNGDGQNGDGNGQGQNNGQNGDGSGRRPAAGGAARAGPAQRPLRQLPGLRPER
jgi:membrane peptidoglycan carboxypeptidase